MSFAKQARRIVGEKVPELRCAFLTGSAARGTTTPTSDIDIYVVTEANGPFRMTFIDEGRLVELFINTDDSMRTFADSEVQARLPTTIHMLAESVVVEGEDEGQQIQAWARKVWLDGPPPFSEDERDAKRYLISSLADDLTDAQSQGEAIFVTNELIRELADIYLITNGRWRGRGKWLERRLRDADVVTGEAFAQAYQSSLNGDWRQLTELTRSVLEPLGGYLQEGYSRGTQ